MGTEGIVKTRFTMKSKVWFYSGKAGWYFLTLAKEPSESIRKTFGPLARPWGSLPVTVTIGKTSWETSIFPDKKAGAYLLPLKADVRKKEKIAEGDRIAFSIAIRFP